MNTRGEQEARQQQLEAWYLADGRGEPGHPLHCLFTGLAAKRRAEDSGEASGEQ